MSEQTKSPIELLYAIEQNSLAVAKGLPQSEEAKESWSGISFRVGEITFVAPLNQVNEILHYPSLTLIPGTQSWIKGVANVRGTLLTVTDLSQFLGHPPIAVNNKARLLVYRREELAVGLLVDEVYGLKHYSDDEKITAVSRFDENLRSYVRGAFKQSGVESLVFNMHALAEDPQFFQVAV